MLGSYKLLVSQKCKNGKKNLTYPGLISPDLTCPIGKKNVVFKEDLVCFASENNLC